MFSFYEWREFVERQLREEKQGNVAKVESGEAPAIPDEKPRENGINRGPR